MLLESNYETLFLKEYLPTREIFRIPGNKTATIISNKDINLMEINATKLINGAVAKFEGSKESVIKLVNSPELINLTESTEIDLSTLEVIPDVSYDQNHPTRLVCYDSDFTEKMGAMYARLTTDFLKYSNEIKPTYGKNEFIGGRNLSEQHKWVQKTNKMISYKYTNSNNQYIFARSIVLTYIGEHNKYAELSKMLIFLNTLNFNAYDTNRIQGKRTSYTLHFLDSSGKFIISLFSSKKPKTHHLKPLWRELFITLDIKQTHPKYFNNTKEKVYISATINPYITRTITGIEPNGRWDESNIKTIKL